MTDYASMTPGCSCDGLRQSMEEVKRLKAERKIYREKALRILCLQQHPACSKSCSSYVHGAPGWCQEVIEEVDA